MTEIINVGLPLEVAEEIDKWVLKFPKQQQQSAIIPALTIVQKYNNGWLSKKLLDDVADYLKLPKINVYEVASFYSNFELKPVGKYHIRICNNISCMLGNCEKIIEHVKNKCDLDVNEVSLDFKFSLKTTECLGMCDKAPVMLINNKYFENLTVEMIDEILKGLE